MPKAIISGNQSKTKFNKTDGSNYDILNAYSIIRFKEDVLKIYVVQKIRLGYETDFKREFNL